MRTLLFLSILLLASCSSPQTHFFSLRPVAPSATAAIPADAAIASRPPIVIRHVMLPATLDRLSIVSSGQQGQLNISSRNRWAAPLDGMVQSVLAADLAALLPGQIVIPGDPVPSGRKQTLAVTIRSFAGDAAGRVTLQADWFILQNGKPVPGMGQSASIAVQAGTAKPATVVPAMSHVLFLLSQRIARAIHAGSEAGPPVKLGSSERQG